MDLSSKSASDCSHDYLCCLFHAIEKSSWRLEKVRISLSAKLAHDSSSRKLAAIDFVGAALALGGSIVFVVGIRLEKGLAAFADLLVARPDLGWRELFVGFASCNCNARCWLRGLRHIHSMAMEGHFEASDTS